MTPRHDKANRPTAGGTTPDRPHDPVQRLLDRLDHRRDGAGWRSRCPACGAGLVITRGRDQDARCICEQGCPPERIAEALGLSAGDLYPDGRARPSGRWRVADQPVEAEPVDDADRADDQPEPERDLPPPGPPLPPPLT